MPTQPEKAEKPHQRWLWRGIIAASFGVGALIFVIVVSNTIVLVEGSGDSVSDPADAPQAQAAIVLGALVEPDGDIVLPDHHPRRTDFDPRAAKRAERQVSIMFTLSAVFTVAFVVAYVMIPTDATFPVPFFGTWSASNTALGVTFGLAAFFIGAGIMQWAKKLMNDKEVVAMRHSLASPEDSREEAIRDDDAGSQPFNQNYFEDTLGRPADPSVPGDIASQVARAGAIVGPPTTMQDVNPNYWPGFDWAMLAEQCGVFLPMNYWTNRLSSSPWRDAAASTAENIRRLKAAGGRADYPVHVVGGAAASTTRGGRGSGRSGVGARGACGAPSRSRLSAASVQVTVLAATD